MTENDPLAPNSGNSRSKGGRLVVWIGAATALITAVTALLAASHGLLGQIVPKKDVQPSEAETPSKTTQPGDIRKDPSPAVIAKTDISKIDNTKNETPKQANDDDIPPPVLPSLDNFDPSPDPHYLKDLKRNKPAVGSWVNQMNGVTITISTNGDANVSLYGQARWAISIENGSNFSLYYPTGSKCLYYISFFGDSDQMVWASRNIKKDNMCVTGTFARVTQ